MDRARHKRNYDLHSWTGIALGLIIYIVAFTGCFALFADEIRTWENPAQRIAVPAEPVEITPAWEVLVEEKTDGGAHALNFARMIYPSATAPYFQGLIELDKPQLDAAGEPVLRAGGGVQTEHLDYEIHWHPETGEEIAMRGGGLSEWVLDFHRDFMWPDALGGRTIGRTLVGVVGVILLVSIISGVIAHTKIRQEAYSMRLKRSQRLKWQDSHKVVGLWGLPFFTMISFTGAFLGVVALLAPIVAAIAFKGDLDALNYAIFGDPVSPTGEQVQMMSFEELAALRHPDGDRAPDLIIMENYGDAAAVFTLFYEADTELANFDTLAFSGATGEPAQSARFGPEVTAAQRVTNAMTPLHYGTFGGFWLKHSTSFWA